MKTLRRLRSKSALAAARVRSCSKTRSPKKPPVRRIGIVVADDLPMDRQGMVALLGSQSDFEVLGEAASVDETAALCADLEPSIVILALRLESGNGRTAVGAVRAQSPNVAILAVAERGAGHCLVLNPPGSRRESLPESLLCSSGTDCLQLAVAEGATGTIRRSATSEELFRAVRLVASGSAWYEAGTATAIMRHALGEEAPRSRPELSPRELEVAELIAGGHSNKKIASILKITAPTVKKHVGHLLVKLELQDRLQIGLYVARNPLLLRPLASRRA